MIKDISGQKFGRLTVHSLVGVNKNKAAVWSCRCDCGNLVEAIGFNLRNGNTKSCGCLLKEFATNLNLAHGHAAEISGNKSPTYRTWRSMINRCYRPQEDSYQYYGGKGITVCDRWRNSFADFLSDMGERPQGKTLDREESNGNYEPSNCRWADAKTQSRNRGKSKNNKSGYQNVHWRKNRWLVLFSIDGKKKYFGSFTDVDAAGAVANEVRRLRA